MKHVNRKTEPRSPRQWITPQQRDQLLAVVRKQKSRCPHYELLATAAYTGMRWQELAQLDIEDLDFKRLEIHVRPKFEVTEPGKAHYSVRWTPKSERFRVIPMARDLVPILEGYVASRAGPVFLTQDRVRYVTQVNHRLVRG